MSRLPVNTENLVITRSKAIMSVSLFQNEGKDRILNVYEHNHLISENIHDEFNSGLHYNIFLLKKMNQILEANLQPKHINHQ